MSGENDQELGVLLSHYLEGVFGAGRDDHRVVLLHPVGLAVDPHFERSRQYHDQLVDGMGVEGSAGAWLGGVQAQGGADAVFVGGDVPLAVTGPPRHFGGVAVIDYRHSSIPVS